jgi:hypothetical protein
MRIKSMSSFLKGQCPKAMHFMSWSKTWIPIRISISCESLVIFAQVMKKTLGELQKPHAKKANHLHDAIGNLVPCTQCAPRVACSSSCSPPARNRKRAPTAGSVTSCWFIWIDFALTPPKMLTNILVGGIPTLKNMSSSVGMMTFPIYGNIKFHGSSHHQAV